MPPEATVGTHNTGGAAEIKTHKGPEAWLLEGSQIRVASEYQVMARSHLEIIRSSPSRNRGKTGGPGSRRVCSKMHKGREVAEQEPGPDSRGLPGGGPPSSHGPSQLLNQEQVIVPHGSSNSFSAKGGHL